MVVESFIRSRSEVLPSGLASTALNVPRRFWVVLSLSRGQSRGRRGGVLAAPSELRPFLFSPLCLLAAVLKAEQAAAVFKFPLAPLGCSGLGSALLAAGSGFQGGGSSGPSHLPLELHLRGKLEPAGPEVGGKAKKGRRSRTVFTELQLMGLEKRFEKQKYLSTPDRCAPDGPRAQHPSNNAQGGNGRG